MTDFSELTDKIKKFHHYESIIGILDQNDYLKIATTVYEILLKITTYLPMVKRNNPKNAETSAMYRYSGNGSFESVDYEDAFQLYNLAIIHAPLDSRELILAYSNRSALHCKLKKYSAALTDIEKCLSLNCNQELRNKLNKRKEECVSMMWQEDVIHNNEFGGFNDNKASEDFFKVSGKRNPKYPLAKNAVNIILKNGKETVVAQSDIKLGEIIVIETAFVSSHLEDNKLVLCYNCNKAAYNMIPCKTCAHVLYCDEACRDQSWAEQHNIECPMMELFTCLPFWCQIWMKFVFKTWNMNRDLKKFAEISSKIDALMQGKANPAKLEMDKVETFLHPPARDLMKRYGCLYDVSINAALMIHGLKAVPVSCFGKVKRETVINHMIKQFMYHALHTPLNTMSGATLPMNEEDAIVDSCESIGFFPFISRCQHDCNANTLCVGLGNKMALVAVLPIKAGTEVTVALGGGFADNSYKERQYSLYNIYSIICECQACTEDWPQHSKDLYSRVSDVEALKNRFQWTSDKRVKYKLMCESMSQQPNGATDKIYQLNYTMFRQLLSVYQNGLNKRRFQGKARQLQSSEIENICNMKQHLLGL